MIIGKRVEGGFGMLQHGHARRSFERIVGGVRPERQLSQRDRCNQEGVRQFRGVVQPQGRDDAGRLPSTSCVEIRANVAAQEVSRWGSEG